MLPSMPVPLRAFLDEIDKLPNTVRFKDLAELSTYYRGTQYEDRELDASGYRKGNRDTYGSAARTPSWSERDPGAVWNLRAEIVEELTEWALGGDAWCHAQVPDDADSQDWLETLIELSGFRSAIAQARNYGGAVRNAIVSFAVRDGEFAFEAHDPVTMWALEWADARSHRLASVVSIFRGEDPLALKEEDRPWMARYWDAQVEQYWRRSKYRNQQTNEWDWTLEPDGEVTHGFGFCPVRWHPNDAEGGRHDGRIDGEGSDGEIDDANELLCAASCTTKRNAEDTVVVKTSPMNNTGRLRKGNSNAIFSEGGAEYLSQDGESARICMEVAKLRAQHVRRRAGMSPVEVEDLSAQASGEFVKRALQRTATKAGKIRDDYGRGLIVPLLRDVLEASRKLEGRPVLSPAGAAVGVQKILMPPRVDDDKKLTWRKPGNGRFVLLVWPAIFPPTPDDMQKLVDSTVKAVGAKPIMSQRTGVAMLAASNFPVKNIEEELDAIHDDEEQKAKRDATAMGMDPIGPGAAGAVEIDTESDSTGKAAAE